MIRFIIATAFFIMGAALNAQTTKSVDITNSIINWTGKKVTGQHTGDIHLKEGALEFTDGALSGGSFTIDMSSLKTTDLQGEMADKLNGHLRSDDFFGVTSYPTALLVITDVKVTGGTYNVTADLTIKDTTAPVTFETTITPDAAKADITVDRTVYNVRYGSGKFFENLGDKTIYDNFDLSVSLVF